MSVTECLDILLISLDQSPTSSENIPVLFFLAESVLYSLRTDVIYEQFLGSSEVKLLLIGQRVFVRLFFHHMCGQMMEFVDLKCRLHTYLDGRLGGGSRGDRGRGGEGDAIGGGGCGYW